MKDVRNLLYRTTNILFIVFLLLPFTEYFIHQKYPQLAPYLNIIINQMEKSCSQSDFFLFKKFYLTHTIRIKVTSVRTMTIKYITLHKHEGSCSYAQHLCAEYLNFSRHSCSKSFPMGKSAFRRRKVFRMYMFNGGNGPISGGRTTVAYQWQKFHLSCHSRKAQAHDFLFVYSYNINVLEILFIWRNCKRVRKFL